MVTLTAPPPTHASTVSCASSSWTRAIVLSLAIVYAANPRRPLPAGFHLDELRLPGASPDIRRKKPRFGWHNSFLAADGIFKWWERRGPRHLRGRAIRRAEAWMVERIRNSDGLGAIFPPMMYSVMALDVLGYAPDHPVRVEALRQFLNGTGTLPADESTARRLIIGPCGATSILDGLAEVMAPGREPHWRWSDVNRLVYRIHTKHIGTEPA